MAKFYERDGVTGQLANAGWPTYVRGILSAEEQAAVEAVDQQHFAWEQRRGRVLETIRGMDADLLSLVELDDYDFFAGELDALGYSSLWHKRPRTYTYSIN
jgi:hypothetical protein